MTQKREPYLVQVAGRDTWYIRDGDKRVSTRKTDVTEAAEVLAEYRAKLNGDQVRRGKAGLKTVADLLAFWEKSHKAKEGGEASWKQKWQYVCATLKRHAGHKALAAIDADWSRGYVADREAEEVIGPTIRQELTTLLGAWRAAEGARLVSLPAPTLQLPKASDPRDVFITKEEAKRLISECKKPHLELFVRLGLATGGRPGALLSLQWRHVDLEKGQVDFRPSGQRRRSVDEKKRRADGKRAALVPIGEKIVARLKEAKFNAQTDFVIEFAGKPVVSVKKSFKEAVKRAGLDPEEITPHILRHSAATWQAQAGVTMWEIAGFLGHSSVAMVEKVYGHHSPNYMKRGRDALDLD